MKNHGVILFICIIVALIQSCAQYTYFPQVPQTPVSENKELDIACTELLSLTGWQISYSAVNKLTLGIAGDYGIRIPHAGFETGAGYYDNITSKIKYGIYGGYGLTDFHLKKDCSSLNGDCYYNPGKEPEEKRLRISDQTYQKLFLQPYFVFSNADVTLNLGFKGTWIYYPAFHVMDSIFQLYPPELNEMFLYTKEYRQINGEAVSLQPYFSLYVGDDQWQGIFSASYQWIPYTNIDRNYLLSPKPEFSVGINRKIFPGKNKAL